MHVRRSIPISIPLLAVAALLTLTTGSSHAQGGKVALVAYSTPTEAFQRSIQLFNRTRAGRGVSFSQSYGASGDQSRAVVAGQSADVVNFSLEPDLTRLVDAGKVGRTWSRLPRRGIVSTSVVVLTVRKGNPKRIRDWADLVKPGIRVVTADPFLSGGAKWNVLAAYGAALRANRSAEQATQYLRAFFANAPNRPKSARDALNLFKQGYGDVLVTYENEAIYANHHGEDFDYVIPRNTILIENPVAYTANASAAAKAFTRFLFTSPAQRAFATAGYRSVIPSLVNPRRFPKPRGSLFTIRNMGGWELVNRQFFTPRTGIVARAGG